MIKASGNRIRSHQATMELTMRDTPQISGYEIEKQLGQGGMATVYLAVQESFGRKVALKVMSDRLGEDSVWAKRFIHEAQVIAQLSHPNIIPVFDVGTHEGKFYISMEFMKGGNLPDKMETGIPIAQCLTIVAGVAAGLDFAGEKGFVHRDIKPDNIMFREDGSPVILDFGIVKQLGGNTEADKMTQTGTIVGTTTYMSPEQALGRSLDHRSDIYSLGIMFYELLTGQPPFIGDSAVAVLFKHVNEDAPALPDHLSALQPVLDKSLAKSPDDRYSRASEMIEHLQSLEDEIKKIASHEQACAQQDTVIMSQTDEATVIQKGLAGQLGGTNNNDGTIISAPQSQKTVVQDRVTQEIEITKVLSSAQATIKDFSAEARAKKARKTKNLFAGMSLIAVCALSYVGYQQFYVVPQERAAAEAKIKDAELKTQKKLLAMHADAKASSQGVSYDDLASVDKVLSIYREILKIDPENKQAQRALSKIGNQYITLANSAITEKNLDSAETYREYAQQLAPTAPSLATLRDDIQSLRAESVNQQLGDQFREEKITTLINVAKTDLHNVAGFSDDAYTKLQQVIHISPNHPEAHKLISDMFSNLISQTKESFENGHLAQAEHNIEMLEKYDNENPQIASLKSSLRAKKSRASSARDLKQLTTKASRLKRERRTIGINDELRETYLTILKASPNHKQAILGLNKTSEFEIELGQKAINDRDFARAQQHAGLVSQYTPTLAGLRDFTNTLKARQKAVKEANAALLSAKKLVNKEPASKEKRKKLNSAYAAVVKAEKIDPKHPKITETKSLIESAYIADITQLISSQDAKLMSAYFKDTTTKIWPSDRLLKLQLTQQSAAPKKAKKKRVIIGGF